ncbi:MAG: hypothetical protein WCF78_04450 [archaeon]
MNKKQILIISIISILIIIVLLVIIFYHSDRTEQIILQSKIDNIVQKDINFLYNNSCTLKDTGTQIIFNCGDYVGPGYSSSGGGYYEDFNSSGINRCSRVGDGYNCVFEPYPQKINPIPKSTELLLVKYELANKLVYKVVTVKESYTICGQSKECVTGIAKDRNDISYCNSLAPDEGRYFCFTDIAVLQKNISICDMITYLNDGNQDKIDYYESIKATCKFRAARGY